MKRAQELDSDSDLEIDARVTWHQKQVLHGAHSRCVCVCGIHMCTIHMCIMCIYIYDYDDDDDDDDE